MLVVDADPEGKKLRWDRVEKRFAEVRPPTLRLGNEGLQKPSAARRTIATGPDPLGVRYDGRVRPPDGPSALRTPTLTEAVGLHMIGAPSQLDLFDPKPELVKRDGEPCPESLLTGKRFAFLGAEKRLAGSRFKFAPHGESGQQVSELLPQLAKVADNIAVVRTLHTEEINHAPAQIFLHTGFGRGDRPSFGSWVTYGLPDVLILELLRAEICQRRM